MLLKGFSHKMTNFVGFWRKIYCKFLLNWSYQKLQKNQSTSKSELISPQLSKTIRDYIVYKFNLKKKFNEAFEGIFNPRMNKAALQNKTHEKQLLSSVIFHDFLLPYIDRFPHLLYFHFMTTETLTHYKHFPWIFYDFSA